MSASALISELSARYPVRDVSVQEPDIEDVIRAVYGRDVGARCSQPVLAGRFSLPIGSIRRTQCRGSSTWRENPAPTSDAPSAPERMTSGTTTPIS